jgi:hypothetical protein
MSLAYHPQSDEQKDVNKGVLKRQTKGLITVVGPRLVVLQIPVSILPPSYRLSMPPSMDTHPQSFFVYS